MGNEAPLKQQRAAAVHREIAATRPFRDVTGDIMIAGRRWLRLDCGHVTPNSSTRPSPPRRMRCPACSPEM